MNVLQAKYLPQRDTNLRSLGSVKAPTLPRSHRAGSRVTRETQDKPSTWQLRTWKGLLVSVAAAGAGRPAPAPPGHPELWPSASLLATFLASSLCGREPFTVPRLSPATGSQLWWRHRMGSFSFRHTGPAPLGAALACVFLLGDLELLPFFLVLTVHSLVCPELRFLSATRRAEHKVA